MREANSPVEQFQEIHGFDESQARGRPCETLPKYGNIPEINNEEEIPSTYARVTRDMKKLEIFQIIIQNEIKSLLGNVRILKEFKHFLYLNKDAENISLTDSATRAKWEKALGQCIKIQFDPIDRQEMNDHVKLALQETMESIASYRERIPFVNRQIALLGKKAKAMRRLTPDVAYSLACSEFYMLRQQEEVETRIAVEQARCFKRKMGLSVNEAEMQKEQITLEEWKIQAERHQRLTMDAKIKRKQNETGIIAAQVDQNDTPDEEVNLEQT
jgi:hypothetical protein